MPITRALPKLLRSYVESGLFPDHGQRPTMYAMKKLNASNGTIERSILSRRLFSSLDLGLGAGLVWGAFSTQDSGSFSVILLVLAAEEANIIRGGCRTWKL